MDAYVKQLREESNLETRFYKGIEFIFTKDSNGMTPQQHEDFKQNKMLQTYQEVKEGKFAKP